MLSSVNQPTQIQIPPTNIQLAPVNVSSFLCHPYINTFINSIHFLSIQPISTTSP